MEYFFIKSFADANEKSMEFFNKGDASGLQHRNQSKKHGEKVRFESKDT
jgi:hypothetical protein